ncbi:hypothetical protein GCM10025862_39190 [Arsenicicoccus piscis]|uniref:Uncharacterized protein n=1 Tax=Arsenicicoccus piscis TaxID=673954 RepID=A0ABQ6HTP3_9MICO|nr:hypothetical protein GCM10025862_39190 [Arsenicicoccus piscis]
MQLTLPTMTAKWDRSGLPSERLKGPHVEAREERDLACGTLPG